MLNEFLSIYAIWAEIKQETQLRCYIFRQTGVEMIDRTYNKLFSIETLSAEFKPQFCSLMLLTCNFLLNIVFDEISLHFGKQSYVAGEL